MGKSQRSGRAAFLAHELFPGRQPWEHPRRNRGSVFLPAEREEKGLRFPFGAAFPIWGWCWSEPARIAARFGGWAGRDPPGPPATGLGSARERHKPLLVQGCIQGLQIHTETPFSARGEGRGVISTEGFAGMSRSCPREKSSVWTGAGLVVASPRQPRALPEPETPGILPPSPQQSDRVVSCAPHWGLQAHSHGITESFRLEKVPRSSSPTLG